MIYRNSLPREFRGLSTRELKDRGLWKKGAKGGWRAKLRYHRQKPRYRLTSR